MPVPPGSVNAAWPSEPQIPSRDDQDGLMTRVAHRVYSPVMRTSVELANVCRKLSSRSSAAGIAGMHEGLSTRVPTFMIRAIKSVL